MSNWTISQVVDLARGHDDVVFWQKALMVPGDHEGHLWKIEVLNGGKPADLQGYSVNACFVRNSNPKSVVTIDGSIDGNSVCVTLKEACYQYEGQLRGLVQIVKNGQRLTIVETHFKVKEGIPDLVVDPDHVIPSLQELLAQIDALKAATAESRQVTADARSAIVEMESVAVDAAPPIVVDASALVLTVSDAADRVAVNVVSDINFIQSGTGDPSPENVRPITGFDAVNLTRTGRNMVSHLDYIITQYHVATVITEDVIDVKTPSNYDYGKIPVHLKGGVTYTLVIDWEVYGRAEDAADVTTCSYRIDKLQSSATTVRASQNTTQRMVTAYAVTEDIDANILWYPNYGGPSRAASRSRVMLLVGEYTAETAPAFEPCRKQVLTAALPETVYGGELDWTSGQLTITHGADGTELATPRTAQVAPQVLNMLQGENCLWSDAGNTALTYNADVKLYIDNAIASITAAEGVAF